MISSHIVYLWEASIYHNAVYYCLSICAIIDIDVNPKFYQSCSFLILRIYQTNHLLFLSIIITQYSDWTILCQLFTYIHFTLWQKYFLFWIKIIKCIFVSFSSCLPCLCQKLHLIRMLSSILANSLWKEYLVNEAKL